RHVLPREAACRLPLLGLNPISELPERDAKPGHAGPIDWTGPVERPRQPVSRASVFSQMPASAPDIRALSTVPMLVPAEHASLGYAPSGFQSRHTSGVLHEMEAPMTLRSAGIPGLGGPALPVACGTAVLYAPADSPATPFAA